MLINSKNVRNNYYKNKPANSMPVGISSANRGKVLTFVTKVSISHKICRNALVFISWNI